MCKEKLEEIGKDGIVKEGIFVRFPELVPAVSEHYWREDGKHKKLLLIGESNYFNDNDVPESDFLNSEKWYTGADAKLSPEKRKTDVSNYISYPTFNKVFNIMDEVLDESGIEHLDGLGEAAFYNYFLRPAYDNGTEKGFDAQFIDETVAGEALVGIIDVIFPEVVVFLSKKAYDSFISYCKTKGQTFDGIMMDCVSHPASIWWNRDEGVYGKVKFKNLLKEHWIDK